MKFPVGQVVITPKAAELLRQWGQQAEEIITRHCNGDWGDVALHERELNEAGLRQRFNLVSKYSMPGGQFLTVITKADRSSTVVCLGIPTVIPAEVAPIKMPHLAS